MPITITVLTGGEAGDGGEAPSLTFEGPRVVLGRGRGSDVWLPDASVSHRHAVIELRGATAFLQDEGSSNGTFASGARLPTRVPQPIKSGAVVRLGRVWLEVVVESRPPTRDLPTATRDFALGLVSGALRAMGEENVPTLVVAHGPDAEARLPLTVEGNAYRVGRGNDCDLQLSDGDTSRSHVTVVRRGGTVLVRDDTSLNGALLDDAPLSPGRDAPWKAGQMLVLGATVLVLVDPGAEALRSIEEAPDEPMEDGEAVSAPQRARTAGAPATGLASPAPRAVPAPAPLPSPPPSRAPTGGASPRPAAPEVGLVVVAVAILALSLAGLAWLLRT